MTREDIIRMAREAGIGWGEGIGGMPDFLERFAALVADAENEACANAADEHMQKCEGKSFGVGAAIRARRQA